MKKIVLVSCSSKKKQGRHKAKDLYASQLFTKAYRYAESLNPDRIFILSAKYGLLDPEKFICNYDMTLNKFSSVRRKAWANDVLQQMTDNGLDLENDEFIFLTGKRYWFDILNSGRIKNFRRPYFDNNLKGIGEILNFLSYNTK